MRHALLPVRERQMDDSSTEIRQHLRVALRLSGLQPREVEPRLGHGHRRPGRRISGDEEERPVRTPSLVDLTRGVEVAGTPPEGDRST